MSTMLLLLFLGLIVWFWLDSLRARESAYKVSSLACREYGVQLLDDTVVLEKLTLRRAHSGFLQTERIYRFEFTETGSSRQLGRLIMLGRHVEVMCMENRDLLIP
jgi:hypothetical protein